ncbi:hypothetical protein DM01DRAFT_1343130 [Hesseltinella vesiculosa]|uniref:RING-type domain-containing protein n=1 Tax=Hesseltinella vesiculosa TaxID=101127 RepID=A0A1X2GTB0_9FUNG|nr:hypothetical protein DM01DRAFT_1343130 [Hesseltinella vesiculosa]
MAPGDNEPAQHSDPLPIAHPAEEKSLCHLLQDNANQICIVCLEDFLDQVSIIRELGCHHIYHAHCIDSWLSRNPCCPLCKTKCVLPEIDQNDNRESIASPGLSAL